MMMQRGKSLVEIVTKILNKNGYGSLGAAVLKNVDLYRGSAAFMHLVPFQQIGFDQGCLDVRVPFAARFSSSSHFCDRYECDIVQYTHKVGGGWIQSQCNSNQGVQPRKYFRWETCRGFAAQGRSAARGVPKGAYTASPGSASMGTPMRVAMVSSNLIAEPYKGELKKLPFSAWFTPLGWRQRWNRWLHSLKSIYTLAKIRRNMKEFSMPLFKKEAISIYERVCAALASGDRTKLRQLVSPVVYTDMKKQLKAREEGGWKRIEWNMSVHPELHTTEVVQGRLIAADPKNDDTAFAQLTVKFSSSQKFAVFDSKSKLISGSLSDDIQVIDHWVFERPLKQQGAKWRVAGRLSIPVIKELDS